MRKVKVLVFLIILLFLAAGCQTLQQKWDKATDDEKARIVVSQTQKSLKSTFITSKAFVDLNPKYQAEWKTKIIPMFDAANKILGDLIDQGAQGKKLTYMGVLSAFGGRIGEIMAAMAAWGVKLSDFKSIEAVDEVTGKEVVLWIPN